jgi:putative nucleotidyltransferase with HDIG domain
LLIVDDEAGIRKVLHLQLSREGYRCKEAATAEKALDILTASPIALVILDIRLPDKPGTELLPEIKSGYPDTAVVMATVVSKVSVATQCLQQGADDYICKPFDLDQVSLSVRRALEKRALRIKIKEYQQNLEEKVEEQTLEISNIFLGAIEALASALEAKDRYTGGHSRRVSEIALALGTELGLSATDLQDLRWGSLLHDVGKIAVDQLIQNKPGSLTSEEYEHVMIHTRVGADIVRPVVNERITQMIEHHHDHYDGYGLNQVVAGKDIPLGARILAVADAFDALTSDRPYRPAISREEALEEIKRCIGTQFDPVVVNAFLKIISRGSEGHARDYQDRNVATSRLSGD